MSDELIDQIEGEFTRNLYKTDGYMVSKFKTNEGTIVVTGPSFDYDKNTKYVLTGSYVNHPKYGFQFQMKSIDKYLSTNEEEIINFLSSKSFPLIGKSTAKKIYEHFKDQTLNILKEDPSRIYEVNLKPKQYASLQNGFENLNDPINEILFYLLSNGFNNNDAQKIFNKFKLATIEVSQDNPFRYYNEVSGISFDTVTKFASKIEFDDAENKYKEAYILNTITNYCFNTGDTYILESSLIDILKQYGFMNNYDDIIKSCIDKEYIVADEDKLYLYNDYYDEKFIADYLRNFKTSSELEEELILEGIENCQNNFDIVYDDKQKQAIYNFFSNDISIIVGGPGTGKTTIVKSMVDMYKEYFPYNNLIVVAPTGRAAKRVAEMCDCESKTIHSLLRWNLESNTFAFDADNPILYDAIIIDEFSMVDNNLFASLLKASSKVKKICIIGDENQLPSIRPGFVLNDLIESNIFVTTHLTLNYRQSSGNEIISLAKDIIDDNVDLDRYKKDICFIDAKLDKYDLINLIDDDINQGFNINEIMVLSPMYKGELGIEYLNVLLQKTYNPSDPKKNEKNAGIYTFRENDKVLQLKNRPNDDVYNGDIGILEDVDKKEKALLVNYQGTYVFYNYEELAHLSLAYAMSVHKAQGSEYQVVYLILNRNNLMMLNKNLIYTAISRAKKKLVIISDKNVFFKGLSSNMKKRNTSLCLRLKQ